jgi:hypothetical protein
MKKIDGEIPPVMSEQDLRESVVQNSLNGAPDNNLVNILRSDNARRFLRPTLSTGGFATTKEKLDAEIKQVGPGYFSVIRSHHEGGLFSVCNSKYQLLEENSGRDFQGEYRFLKLCEDLGSKDYVILDHRKFKIFYRGDDLKEAMGALHKPEELSPLPENESYKFITRSL